MSTLSWILPGESIYHPPISTPTRFHLEIKEMVGNVLRNCLENSSLFPRNLICFSPSCLYSILYSKYIKEIWQDCRLGDNYIIKWDKFNLDQCLKINFKIKEMEKYHYASSMGNRMYVQVYMCKNITYIVKMLDRYLKIFEYGPWENSKMIHTLSWKTKILHARI